MCYFIESAYTHSGRTDANGGHYNRKTGAYHYHNGSKRPPQGPSNTERPDTEKPENSLMLYPTGIFFEDTAYPVTRIIDGDTVEIRYDGKLTSVVLIGVDTPETVHP